MCKERSCPTKHLRDTAAQRQTLYVRTLLRLLPHLLSLFRHTSRRNPLPKSIIWRQRVHVRTVRTRDESDDLRVCARARPGLVQARAPTPGRGPQRGARKRPRLRRQNAATVDRVIASRARLRVLCFSGGMTLQDALAQPAFSTQGPQQHGRRPHLYVHGAAEDVLPAGARRRPARRRRRRRREGRA